VQNTATHAATHSTSTHTKPRQDIPLTHYPDWNTFFAETARLNDTKWVAIEMGG